MSSGDKLIIGKLHKASRAGSLPTAPRHEEFAGLTSKLKSGEGERLREWRWGGMDTLCVVWGSLGGGGCYCLPHTGWSFPPSLLGGP